MIDILEIIRLAPPFDFAAAAIPDIETFRRVELGAVRSTDGETGPVHAARANAIHTAEITLDYSLLNDDEADALNECWNAGGGQTRPFVIQLIDETTPRLVVFADDTFALNYRNAKIRSSTIRLFDVTPAGTFS